MATEAQLQLFKLKKEFPEGYRVFMPCNPSPLVAEIVGPKEGDSNCVWVIGVNVKNVGNFDANAAVVAAVKDLAHAISSGQLKSSDITKKTCPLKRYCVQPFCPKERGK